MGREGGGWEGGFARGVCCPGPLRRRPRGGPGRPPPPTCPYHPTFLSRSAPSSDLAVMEIAEQSTLSFVGSLHQMEMRKGDNVDAESQIHFAMSGVALWRGRPRCGISSTQPQRGVRPNVRRLGHGQSHVHVIARCACLCVCLLHCQIGRN